MKTTPLARALLIAGAVALAGAAQAQTSFDSPTQAGEASTMTHGQPNAETTNSPYADGSHTMILGAGPAVVTQDTYVTTYTLPHSYVLPAPVVTYGYMVDGFGGASESSNVPHRAGEASTMTNGVPNLLTTN